MVTNGWIASTAAVGDVDGDAAKGLEVVVGTRTGYLFAWKTKGKSDGAVEWESFHHDNANTGNYATKLEQGRLQKASKPLDCSVPAAPASEKFDAAGCTCTTTASATTSTGATAGLFAGALAIASAFARRRRR